MNKSTVKLPSWWYPSEVAGKWVGWVLYFAALYLSVWIPGKFNYTTEVNLGPLMIPWFVWTWIFVNALTIVGLFVLYRQLKSEGLLDSKEEE
ncbi:MAG: hypothetical protein K6U74_16870 [Firmicutes bacterium]|nr:hypothetical protein [Bacillota bacterium]